MFSLTVVFLYSFLFPMLTPNCQDEGITLFCDLCSFSVQFTPTDFNDDPSRPIRLIH